MTQNGGRCKMITLMKRFTALAVLVIFILSIMPAALAEKGENQPEEIIIKGKENTVEVIKKVQDKLGEKEVLMQKAQIALGNVLEKQQELRERFVEAKQKQLEQRKDLSKIKLEAKRCQTEEACAEKKFSLKLGVKNHLLNTLEVMEKHLERTQSRAGEEDYYLIQEKLDQIAELKEKVETLTKDSTAEEIQGLIDESKVLWQEVKDLQKDVISNLVEKKTKAVVEKYHGLVNSMDSRIATIERLGGDTTELEAIKTEFIAKIEEMDAAHETYKQAREEWKKSGDKKNAEKQWRERHREEKNILKESRDILRNFVVKFNKVKKELLKEISEEEFEDAEQEAEETEEEDKEVEKEEESEKTEEEEITSE